MASFVGYITGTSQTVTLPSHQEGDLLLLNAVRSGGGFFAGDLTDWGVLYLSAANSIRQVFYYTVAGSTTVSNPTLSLAPQCTIAAVYRPAAGTILIPWNQSSTTATSSSTATYPALESTDDMLVVAVIQSTTAAGSLEVAPTGTTNRAHIENTAETALHGTGAVVTGWSAQTANLVSPVTWRTVVQGFKECPYPASAGSSKINPYHTPVFGA